MNALIHGILLGGGYALIACGLSLTFGVMRLVNIAHGDLAVCGAYLALLVSTLLDVPATYTLPLVLPAAFGLGWLLHVTLFERALASGPLAPVLVTFGLSVMIQNLLTAGVTANPRTLDGGPLSLASVGGVSLLRIAAFVVAVAVLGGLQLVLSRTAFGRRVRATADDVETAQLVGIRVRPLFAAVAGIAVATAALAGVFLGLMGTVDPYAGGLSLIFAFEAVVIGGIGSLWGTLVGGVVIGLTQQLAGLWNAGFSVLAVHLLFFVVLTVRPRGLLG
ncbi:branched-chain amino acid ABC transporter permease [Nonomuraea monospora]|uniref:Branched-chain amino acid ABC transporter permease n=1 Tax=Nonomuraea monospora TaxID=568818 RepID=A0ABN3CYM2_9ACTN